MRLITAAFLTVSMGLTAQEEPGGNRMGIGLSATAAAGDLAQSFDHGFQVGLQIHFNRESRHLGRLRIDYLQSDSKGPVPSGSSIAAWNGTTWVTVPIDTTSRMEAYSVVYEWMPHLEGHSRSGLFGIFGMGGTLWNETLHRSGPYSWNSHDTELGFTLTAGAGWRFNPHISLEARYVHSDLSFQGYHRYGSNRSYAAVGGTYRF